MEKKKIAVIYKSKYGATKKYAGWIAQALEADLREHGTVGPEELDAYDVVLYGGGLYADGISGIDLVMKHPCRCLAVFTVGLANPLSTDYTSVLKKNIPAGQTGKVKVFHLRGDVDYQRLTLIHRGMMAIRRKMIVDKKSAEGYSEEEQLFLDTYGKEIDFKAEETIQPLVEYVRSLNVNPG